jgi:hypothetical protein
MLRTRKRYMSQYLARIAMRKKGSTLEMIERIILVVHALVGWAICGGTIGLGRQAMSMEATLIVHAALAPLAFGLLSWHYARRFPQVAPATTSLTMLGVVIGLDALVVAPFMEHSYAMFRSVLGTWIPFALIFVASFVVSRAVRGGAERVA